MRPADANCLYLTIGRDLAGICRVTAVLLLMTCLFNREVQAEQLELPSGPDFERHVMAVLSKTGCNLGTCHGNLNGKGGLQLSLRGQDPHHDYLALTQEWSGRRVNRLVPDESLIVLKPTTAIAHEGGQRFETDSVEYQILTDWISHGAAGPQSSSAALVSLEVAPLSRIVSAPTSSVQLSVTALFDDGARHDVTRLATYEVSNYNATISVDGQVHLTQFGETTIAVRYLNQQQCVQLAYLPPNNDDLWAGPRESNYVDEIVFRKLRSLRINPMPVVADHVFLRRVYLDLLGLVPTEEEARQFLSDSSPDKRRRLIDELLTRTELADHWALKWSDLLRNEEKLLDTRGVQAFHQWIRDNFQQGVPLNRFVHELIAARGSTYESPPANFYRAMRDPLTRGETVARLFLGVRMECAKCHNHPFDRWTQDDYYAWAALFARIDYEIIENKRRDELDKTEFNGEQIVHIKDEGEVQNARTGADASPAFLGSAAPVSDEQGRLTQLADWLTSDDNLAFAKAQANRIWFQMMGRGLVDPVDDFRVTNPPSHPELLDTLAQDLIEHEFDLRHLLRTIANSTTYQLASADAESHAMLAANFGCATVRRLTSEQLLDAQCRFLDVAAEFNGHDRGIRAGQLPGVHAVHIREQAPSLDDRFLTMFGKPERLMACECERSDETTLTQTFFLISGEGLQQRLHDRSNRVHRLAESEPDDLALLDRLYWSALSRAPTDEEQAACSLLLQQATDRHESCEDLAWALVNSKEFMFRY